MVKCVLVTKKNFLAQVAASQLIAVYWATGNELVPNTSGVFFLFTLFMFLTELDKKKLA